MNKKYSPNLIKVPLRRLLSRSLSLMLCSTLIACTTAKPDPIDSKLIRPEGYEQIKDGLRIYVLPLEDKDEIKRYFGADLLEKNILPIFILAENGNSSRHFLLEPVGQDDQVSNSEPNKKAEESNPGQAAGISTKSAKEMVYKTDRDRFFITTGILGGPIIFLSALPLAIMSDFEFGPTDASKFLQQALISQSLRKQTLTAGRTEQGFLYYQLPPESTAARTIGILIKATDVETQEVMFFRFTRDYKQGGN